MNNTETINTTHIDELEVNVETPNEDLENFPEAVCLGDVTESPSNILEIGEQPEIIAQRAFHPIIDYLGLSGAWLIPAAEACESVKTKMIISFGTTSNKALSLLTILSIAAQSAYSAIGAAVLKNIEPNFNIHEAAISGLIGAALFFPPQVYIEKLAAKKAMTHPEKYPTLTLLILRYSSNVVIPSLGFFVSQNTTGADMPVEYHIASSLCGGVIFAAANSLVLTLKQINSSTNNDTPSDITPTTSMELTQNIARSPDSYVMLEPNNNHELNTTETLQNQL